MFELHPQLAADCFCIAESELNLLLLMNDRQYPWTILVPKQANIQEIFQLSVGDQQQLIKESSLLSVTLQEQFQADKINVAALGNQVPQLHIHHIARCHDDPSWPKPIWGQLPSIPYPDADRQTRITTLAQSQLSELFRFSFSGN